MTTHRYDLKTSPLFLAIELGKNDAALQHLESQQGQLEIQDLDGNTPLIRAGCLGNLALTQVLLLRGADVNAKNDIGYTALHFAAQEGHAAVAQQLLAKGAAVDALDDNGNTPLSNAVYNEKLDVVRLLLDAGADADLQNAHGVSPRELADSMGVDL